MKEIESYYQYAARPVNMVSFQINQAHTQAFSYQYLFSWEMKAETLTLTFSNKTITLFGGNFLELTDLFSQHLLTQVKAINVTQHNQETTEPFIHVIEIGE